jgi:hypothetical protein
MNVASGADSTAVEPEADAEKSVPELIETGTGIPSGKPTTWSGPETASDNVSPKTTAVCEANAAGVVPLMLLDTSPRH